MTYTDKDTNKAVCKHPGINVHRVCSLNYLLGVYSCKEKIRVEFDQSTMQIKAC